MMIRSKSLWPVVMSGEVNQGTSRITGSKTDQCRCRIGDHMVQGSTQADHRVLKHVVCLFPASQAGEITQHLSGKPDQPVFSRVNKFLPGRRIAITKTLKPVVDFDRILRP